jgi:ABC-2 type transport system permease protein
MMLLAMIKKDILLMIRDKEALIITLFMPAVLTLILGFALGGMLSWQTNIGKAKIAVVNNTDKNKDIKKIESFLRNPLISERISDNNIDLLNSINKFDFEKVLYSDVLENEEIKKFVSYENLSMSEAEKKLKEEEITAVVIIPENFIYDTFISLATPFRKQITIEIIKHPEHELKGNLVEGIMKSLTDSLSAGIIAKSTFLEASAEYGVGLNNYDEIGSIIEGIYKVGVKNVEFERITEIGRNKISGIQYYAVGMGVMFVLFTAGYGAFYTIDELKNKTLSRTIIAGTGLMRILTSRFAATSIFVLFQLFFLIFFSKLVFNIDWGSWPQVLVLSVLLSLTTGSLSVFLSSINLKLQDAKATIVFQSGIIQLMAFLGGSFIPLEGIPFLKKIGEFTINGAAMEGYLMIMKGYQFFEITPVIIILIITAVFLTLSGYLLTLAYGE